MFSLTSLFSSSPRTVLGCQRKGEQDARLVRRVPFRRRPNPLRLQQPHQRHRRCAHHHHHPPLPHRLPGLPHHRPWHQKRGEDSLASSRGLVWVPFSYFTLFCLGSLFSLFFSVVFRSLVFCFIRFSVFFPHLDIFLSISFIMLYHLPRLFAISYTLSSVISRLIPTHE